MGTDWTSIRVRRSTAAALRAELVRLDSLFAQGRIVRFWGRGHLSLDKLVINLLQREEKERLRKKRYRPAGRAEVGPAEGEEHGGNGNGEA